MFLFLSKLIPLLFYPMGMVCILLILALWLRWIKSKWTPAAISLALMILCLSGNATVSNWLVQSLEWQNIPKGELPIVDVIVVLGGGTRSQAYPRPGVDLTDAGDRVWYGAHLYHASKAPKIIVSGGGIGWKANSTPEAEDMTKLLVEMGVPTADILLESNSANTRENAVNVQKILQTQHFGKILLVTSAIHMPRSLAIFKRLGIEAIAAPTDYHVSQLEVNQPNASIEAAILSLLPSEESLSQTTQVIREYVGLLVYKLRGWL
jgi:uncharacterized SAM-binding protein YcdF (DUF218 family)